MRHAKSKNQLNRFSSWRKATVISLAKNLLIRQSIKTTKSRALAARPLAEKLISLAKTNTLAAKRRAYKILGDHMLVSRLFKDIGIRFATRAGGYTRILNLSARRGDNAQMVIWELVEIKKIEIKKPKKEKEPKVEEIVETTLEKKPSVETKPKAEAAVELKEKPPITKKPLKKFLGGVRGIFKKERDSL